MQEMQIKNQVTAVQVSAYRMYTKSSSNTNISSTINASWRDVWLLRNGDGSLHSC